MHVYTCMHVCAHLHMIVCMHLHVLILVHTHHHETIALAKFVKFKMYVHQSVLPSNSLLINFIIFVASH